MQFFPTKKFCLRGNFAYLNHFDHLHQCDIILDFYTISFSIVLNVSFLVSLGCYLLCPQVKYVQLLQIALIYHILNLGINTIACWITIPESQRTTRVRSLDPRCLDRWINASTIVRRGYDNSLSLSLSLYLLSVSISISNQK